MFSSCFKWEDTEGNLRIEWGIILNHQGIVHPTITELGSSIFLGERQPKARIGFTRTAANKINPALSQKGYRESPNEKVQSSVF